MLYPSHPQISKKAAKYSDVGHIEGYISETVQYIAYGLGYMQSTLYEELQATEEISNK